MNKKIKNIILFIIIFVFLFFIFIFFAQNFSPLFKGEKLVDNNNEELIFKNKIAFMKVQLVDAEKELIGLRELSEDQLTSAKIEQFFIKIEYYRSEADKPLGEIDEAIVEEFYNSGFWEEIIKLKNVLENQN